MNPRAILEAHNAVVNAELAALRTERDRLREALAECVTETNCAALMHGAIPTYVQRRIQAINETASAALKASHA